MNVSMLPVKNITQQLFDYIGSNISEFQFSADFDYEDILKEFPELFGNKGKDTGTWSPMTISLAVLYSIAFILGITGNIFVIAVVAQYKHMRTLTNVFLVNLTVGDLLVALICIPITLGEYVYKEYIFGTVMCKLAPFLQGSAVAVSALSLLFIGINRYFAIHRPLKAKIIFSKRKIYLMLVSVWVLSFSAFVPLLVVNHVQVTDFLSFKKRSCSEGWIRLQYKQFYNVFIFVLLFCIPLFVMVLAYTRIGMTLWGDEGKVFIETSRGHSYQAERILRQRRRTVKMLIAVVSIFCICWLPYYIVNIWIDTNLSDMSSTGFVTTYIYPVLQVLGLSNSVVNPVCYCFMSTGFRKAFLKLCCKRQLTKRGSNALLTIRFRSSEDSPIDSLETAISRDHHDHVITGTLKS
ncbi:QRFP-like peptide receptor [Mytilus edulis]|uniref:G-protein coupled receptors family 1 profile domain-containing protein n=1 Tax=Mytilus edulis TaxID=6550 RepID=A0A8S3U6Y1_MYTED|nr:unnamed protein product [Mytilus edulis]